MKLTLQAIHYVIKNIIYILPLVVLPAFCLAISTDREAIRCAIDTLFSGRPTDFHFDHIFRAISILSFTSWETSISGFLAIISMVLFVSLLMAMIEKHMRIGKRTFNGILSKLNDNLLPTLGYIVLLLIIYEFWTLIASMVLFFLSNIPIVPLAYVAMTVVFVLAHVVLLYAIGMIYLWLPCMQITGFRATEALYYSSELSSSVKWKVSFAQLFAFLLVEVLMVLCVMFTASETAFLLLTTACYCALIAIYCVRMEIMYFQLDNIQRADIAKYYLK